MSSPIQDKIVLVPSLEELTVEEQIKMCGETFDQRETRHLAIGQMNICCLGCDEVLWNLRYDADKKISKLISGGLKGYVCGDDSNSACAPEDEDASEYGDETEEEICETCDKTLKPGEGKSQLTGSFSCVVCPDCYEEEDEDEDN